MRLDSMSTVLLFALMLGFARPATPTAHQSMKNYKHWEVSQTYGRSKVHCPTPLLLQVKHLQPATKVLTWSFGSAAPMFIKDKKAWHEARNNIASPPATDAHPPNNEFDSLRVTDNGHVYGADGWPISTPGAFASSGSISSRGKEPRYNSAVYQSNNGLPPIVPQALDPVPELSAQQSFQNPLISLPEDREEVQMDWVRRAREESKAMLTCFRRANLTRCSRTGRTQATW